MKKNFKKIIAILSVLTLLFSLCGCSTMEEIKATHAYFKADTTGVIIYQDTEYLALPKYENFSPNLDDSLYIYITEEDEPMLLREYISLGDHVNISEDHNILICGYECVPTPRAYCRADVYDDMIKLLEQDHPLNGYCYQYSEWDENDNLTTNYHILTQAEIQFVASLMSEENTNVIPRDDFNIMENDEILMVTRCSEDMMFKDEAYEIFKGWDDGNYYLRSTNSSDPVYQVPAQNIVEFEKIFEPAINAYFGV